MTEEIEAKSFVVPVTEERRKLKSLKYTLYCSSVVNELDDKIFSKADEHRVIGKGGWACCVIDNKEKKMIMCGKKEMVTNYKMQITAVIQGLKWILSEYESNIRKHVQIQIYTDSVLVVNFLRDWITHWKREDNTIDDTRPNSSELSELSNLISQINFDAKTNLSWIPKDGNEIMKQLLALSIKARNDSENEVEEENDEKY